MVEGYVASGFEPVALQFEQNFAVRGDVGAAFCAVVDGVRVVDVWGGAADRNQSVQWSADTIAGIFSGSKGLVAVCLLLLVERGSLELDKEVAHYWPEFAAAGKQDIRVRHVVSHQCGLPGLETAVSAYEATDDRRMAALVAAQAPVCRPGERLYYHALTFGWICGELVRRIDGRSVGDFFSQEVARPLGLDVWIGLPAEYEERVARLEREAGFGARRATPVDARQLCWSIWENPPRFAAESLAANSRYWRAAEVPASNAVASARSMARLYGCLARGGEIDGCRLLRPSLVEMARTPLVRAYDLFLDRELAFGIGFQLQSDPPAFGPDHTGYGHPGAGGSVHGAWPDLTTGFSYVTNMLMEASAQDSRASHVLSALHTCLTDVSHNMRPDTWNTRQNTRHV
jgi:CubicO group peptidase (beta-lactamase class C family)